jgi:hypothetical protein
MMKPMLGLSLQVSTPAWIHAPWECVCPGATANAASAQIARRDFLNFRLGMNHLL